MLLSLTAEPVRGIISTNESTLEAAIIHLKHLDSAAPARNPITLVLGWTGLRGNRFSLGDNPVCNLSNFSIVVVKAVISNRDLFKNVLFEFIKPTLTGRLSLF